MTMTAANAFSVRTVDEALTVLDDNGPRVRIIAGGTDLMVLLNAKLYSAPAFLDIWRIDELRGIREDGGRLRIGALTSFTQIVQSELTRTHTPALVEAAQTIGAVQIQNRGTLAGNLVNGSPAGDSLPALSVLDAEIEAASRSRGTRVIPFRDFYTGYRSTVLEADEMVIAITIRKLKKKERSFFYKVGTRRAQAISKVMMAGTVEVADGRIGNCAISFGSMSPVVGRVSDVEAALNGAQIGRELPAGIQQLLQKELSPIDDIRSTATYRMRVACNLLARMLRECAEA